MDNTDSYSFDIGPMGAIGEQGSLLLRINRNCPWNRCLFCSTYKGNKFEYRKVDEIKRDIDAIKFLTEVIRTTSYRHGSGGRVNNEVIRAVLQDNPEIYGKDSIGDTVSEQRYSSLSNVSNWLYHNAKNVFLQDADALIMRAPELIEVIRYLKGSFPSIERITSYARAKTCAQRRLEELKDLHEAGLSRLLIGIESGCDEVLDYMQKGVTAQVHIEGCKKVKESGMTLVTFVMPGLGSKRWADRHVLETVRVLNEIKPHLIRIRSLAIQEDSPLFEKWQSGEFEAPTDDQMVDEIEQLILNLNCDCYVETGQLTNILFEIEGYIPEQKEEIIEIIQGYKTMSPRERLVFRFRRYMGYYVPYISDRGRLDDQLLHLLENAKAGLGENSCESEQKIEQAILAIKQRGIP